MTMVSTGVTAALRALEQAIEAPSGGTDVGTTRSAVSVGNWRWTVRQRMALVRDALAGEGGAHPEDGWLAARGGRAFRERNQLLGRISALGPQVLENPDVDRVRAELRRLVKDVSRHVQRLNDLVYDEVELELGGSE